MTTLHCDMALLVQADFDGELDAGEAAKVAAHLATCPACQATAADLQRIRDDVRAADLRFPAPESLRPSLIARIRAARPSPWRARTKTWGTASAGFGIGVAAALLLTLTPPADRTADEMVAGHVRSLQPGHLMDVASTDRHTVKPWFDGKLDFAPPVKDLAEQGFPLQGGRLDYAQGRPVAAMVYGRAKHTINFFVWPESQQGLAAEHTAQRNGYNVVSFAQNGMAVWVVSDLEKQELLEFVHLWRGAP